MLSYKFRPNSIGSPWQINLQGWSANNVLMACLNSSIEMQHSLKTDNRDNKAIVWHFEERLLVPEMVVTLNHLYVRVRFTNKTFHEE